MDGKIRWRVNGLPLSRNPSVFIVDPTKTVDYHRATHGEEIRTTPDKNRVDRHITVGWQRLEERWRDVFYDLFVRDEKFRLQTHLSSLYTGEYLVKIDEYDEEYINTPEPKWNVTLGLRVLDGINDPILRQTYHEIPYLFVVDNKTNSTIYNANIFLLPRNDIKRPRITQTFWNLLTNPSFEDTDGRTPLGWEDPDSAWRVDIINFYEGERCVGTSVPNAPIYQEVWCPEGEHLTVMFATLGLPGGQLKATLEYLTSSDATINTYTTTVNVTTDHQTHWFSTSEATPSGTRKVRLKFEKTSQDNNYIIVDMAMLRLGASEREPTWTNDRHRTLIYPNSLVRGETLDMNLGLQVATKHRSGPTLPRGGSVFHFDDSFVSQDGIQPEDGYVASLRPNEGKFRGAAVLEEGAENILESPLDFSVGRWSKNSLSVEDAGYIGPGGARAWKIIEDQGGTRIQLRQNDSVDTTQPATISVYLRAGTRRYAYLAFGTNQDTIFDLLEGVITRQASSTDRAFIEPVGDGWYRCWISADIPGTPHVTIAIASGPIERDYPIGVDGGDYIYASLPQAEAKYFPTSFVDGTRPHGYLAYKKHLSITEGFTVRLYARRVN